VAVVLLAIAIVAVVLAVGSLVAAERGRRSTALRIDAVTARVLDEEIITPSVSPTEAATRLEQAVRRGNARADLEASLARFRAALGAISLGVVVLDEHGEVVFHNDAADWIRDGRHADAVVADTVDELAGATAAGERVERELQLYGPPRRRVVVTAEPIAVDGARRGAVVLVDDITERARIDAIRRDFVANISHELRTPIGAMSLLAETLSGETDPEVVESLAARLGRECDRLSGTVDDLLELSRIEHGSDEKFVPVVLQGVVHGAYDRVRAAAQQRSVDVSITLPERDLVVLGDRRQLTSAVFNLLDNGVKYMGPGGGSITVRGRQIDDRIELLVQDSGIGIPRKDLDRIFERFYRVDGGRSRASGGTGLGLAIVRHVVVNHGGEVSVESTEGEGTTFTLDLPVLVPSKNPDPEVTKNG